jgi:hypothetical protein
VSPRPTAVRENRRQNETDVGSPVQIVALTTPVGRGHTLIDESNIRRFELHSDEAMGHLDPVADFPDHNAFFAAVVPFRSIVGDDRSNAID